MSSMPGGLSLSGIGLREAPAAPEPASPENILRRDHPMRHRDIVLSRARRPSGVLSEDYRPRLMSRAPTRRQALTLETLAGLDRSLLRQLCQLIVVERGMRITRVQPRDRQDDLYTTSTLLWRPRPGLVRVLHRPLEPADVESLAEVTRAEPLAEAVLIEGAAGGANLPRDPAVQVIRADQLVAMIRASALVEWEQGNPRPARGRFELATDLNDIAVALDPVGLRWLPTLALNQVPAELEGSGTADELLERIAFRILTTALRFGGHRLGARHRGQRVPDSVLRWNGNAALLDCKAAQYGYRMSIDDERALVEYVSRVRPREVAAGFTLEHIVVISGEFDGELGDSHPYHQRARHIEGECGARLVYLRAADLVRLVVAVESDEAQPADREAIRWGELFDSGMLDSEQVAALWPLER